MPSRPGIVADCASEYEQETDSADGSGKIVRAEVTVMPEQSEIRTPYLILRKTGYSETSLIVAGITPESGRVHFLVRGARRLGRRQFPVVDLFRVLDVVYRAGRGDLHRWRAAALQEDFARLGRSFAAFCAAGWLARLALDNVMPNVPHPRFFTALLCSLRRLSGPVPDADAGLFLLTAAKLGPALVFLEENGSLPVGTGSAPAAAPTAALLDMALGAGPVPTLPAATWDRLWDWMLQLLRQSECRIPGPDSAAATGGDSGDSG